MNKQLSERNSASHITIKSIVGGAVLLAVAVIFAKNFPSLRRYIKMERM